MYIIMGISNTLCAIIIFSTEGSVLREVYMYLLVGAHSLILVKVHFVIYALSSSCLEFTFLRYVPVRV